MSVVDLLSRIEKLERDLKDSNANRELLRNELRRVRERAEDTRRSVSETELENAANMGHAIAHISTLEGSIRKQEEAIGAIVNELGIADKVQLGDTIPPGAKKKMPALSKLSKENKGTLTASVFTTIGIVIQILWKLLEHHR